MIVKKHRQKTADAFIESGQQDLNLRPLGPSRARYQATPYPDRTIIVYQKMSDLKSNLYKNFLNPPSGLYSPPVLCYHGY